MESLDLQKYKLPSVRDAVRYLNGEVKVNRYNESDFSRIIKLKKMINAFDSEKTDFDKLFEMRKIYPTSASFFKAFATLQKFADDSFLGYYVGKWEEIYNFYVTSEQNGVVNEVNALMNMGDYFASYEYAKFLISSYILEEDICMTSKFLDKYGVDEETFNFCAKVIDEFEPDLYSLYEKKVLFNKQSRIANTNNSINNIICGIQNGVMLDGTEFDVVEFYKLLPFDNQVTAKEVLSDFGAKQRSDFLTRFRSLLTTIVPEHCDAVIKYMVDNNITTTALRPFSTNLIYRTNYILEGRELTPEDKDVILSYIDENNIPKVEGAFDAVRKKFLNGEITKDDVKSKKYVPTTKCTLIP